MNQTAKARVLFVDDEPRVLNSMRMLFRSNYEIHVADSGQKALELLRSTPVDVIVSDQRMPGMTGIEMLRQARELNPNAMRILLTGYSDLNAIIGSINEGEIFRFVNKPWSNEDLSTTVARAVEAARASAEIAAKSGEPVEPVRTGPAAGLLVIDDDPAVPPKIQKILGDGYRVFGATSMEEAVNKIDNDHIGVIISETRVQDNPVISLIGTLKKHHPELVSVILTERADAHAAIDLINQGQIYRFITKPIHDSQTRITVNSAMRQHEKLSQHPELQQRYAVEGGSGGEVPAPNTPSGGLIDRIRSLRGKAKPKD